jgi:hypothetical protein
VGSANSTSELAYATTDEGYRLPVIDVTQPEFALPDDPNFVAALFADYKEAERRNALVPGFIMRLMLQSAARRSRLLADILNSRSGFLGGITTYIMKLGAENLPPPFDREVDRRLAAAPHVVAVRLRLQQMVKLLAGVTEPLLHADPAAPLVVVNIGGGTAIDSLNALILLNRSGDALGNRPITLYVLDIDAAGAHFGAAALGALSAEGRALSGLDIAFDHENYDWNSAQPLADLVNRESAAGAIIVACSEGALFEYGSDDAIICNLEALRGNGRGAKAIVGTVTADDELRRRSIAGGNFKLIPRGLDGFRPLAERGGFRIARSESAPLGEQVLLEPM